MLSDRTHLLIFQNSCANVSFGLKKLKYNQFYNTILKVKGTLVQFATSCSTFSKDHQLEKVDLDDIITN